MTQNVNTTPLIYELNARIFGRRFDEITRRDLANFRRLGFSHLWLMGIWRISPGALEISKRFGTDYEGSPYAVPDYEPNPALGSEASLCALRERAHQEGLRIIVDFVPNHTALDSPWIDRHPDFFVSSNPGFRDEQPEWFFDHPSGRRIAYGRDPFFPGWIDTAQLDYANSALREHMIGELARLAGLADGVRCDMAMLLLREQVKKQWYTHVPWDWFNEKMPDEFWREAIFETRRLNPGFLFVAEAYWGKEAYLQQLGFDFTYNKALYDKLVGRAWDPLVAYLELSSREFLSRSVHFIENHDEERAQYVFGPELHRQVAALVLTLPGAALVHQGQMEGRRERLPVQLARPRVAEEDDPTLTAFYHRLLRVASDPVFRAGRFLPFDSGVRGLVSYVRELGGRHVVVAIDLRQGEATEASHGELSVPSTVLAHLPEGTRRLRDLWSGRFSGSALHARGRLVIDLERQRGGEAFLLLEVL